MIARGTHDPQIAGFEAHLARRIAPRLQLSYVLMPSLKDEYLDRIHAEREAIVAMIERQGGDGVRSAMRDHLTNSLERLRALARAAGLDPGGHRT